jgi:DNA ligase (NAD+)
VKLNCRVLIRRSNEVIPEILGATEYFENSEEIVKPVVCPYCGTELEEVGANIFCRNKTCKPRVVAMFANFASKDGMNIDGFSEKTASVLYENFNIVKFHQLYELSVDKLLMLDGFKQKKAENVINSLQASKRVPLENFIYALGIDGVGKKCRKGV